MIDADTLKRHRSTWQRKPLLRMLYAEWYGEIVRHLGPGRTVELGGGSGNLKEHLPEIILTDVVQVPWVDAVVDSRRLPFGDGTIGNLVLFDVLHHIECPRFFFDEALRVLLPEGRLIIMDPYISWLSWPIYRFLHPEPVDFKADALGGEKPEPNGPSPFANQAVATMLFERSLAAFTRRYPRLKVVACRRLAFFAYPLSGGFEHASLLPVSLAKPILALEKRLACLSRLLAFRMIVVLEKSQA